MRVCASYGSVPDRLADADMHELRLDVFDVLPPDLDRDCIVTLAGKDISAVPAGFEGMVDVGDSDAEIPFRKIRSVHDFEKTPSEEVLRRTLETADFSACWSLMSRAETSLRSCWTICSLRSPVNLRIPANHGMI